MRTLSCIINKYTETPTIANRFWIQALYLQEDTNKVKMYIDLNVPVPTVATPPAAQSKKNKGKATQQQQVQNVVTFSPAQLTAVEARLDVLEHCT